MPYTGTPLECASQAHATYVAHKQAMIGALPGDLCPRTLINNLTQAAWKAGYTAAMNWLASNIQDKIASGHRTLAPNVTYNVGVDTAALGRVLDLITDNLADLVPEPPPRV